MKVARTLRRTPLAALAGSMVLVLAAAGVTSSASAVTGTSGAAVPNAVFQAVSAASASDVWAVGYVDGPPLRTLALHWNGRRWSRVPTPDFGTWDNALTGVAGVSAADVWATGFFTPRFRAAAKPMILHWNGRAWSRVPNPAAGTHDVLAAVSATSASDVWAVGATSRNQELVLHWNGHRWAVSPSPVIHGSLTAVSAAARSDVWAVGCGTSGNLAMRWDGRDWDRAQVPRPAGACLHGVSALSATDAWAVGDFPGANPCGCQQALILRWNGRQWSRTPSGAPNVVPRESFLNGVTAISRANAWAAGEVFNGDNQSSHTLIVHWNGTRWLRQASPSPGFSALYGVSGTSARAVWGAGYGNESLVLRWNGGRWVQV